MRGTNCDYSVRINKNVTFRFAGEIDRSTVFVLSRMLGKTNSNTSAEALNETAYQWYQENEQYLNNLVTARGYLLGIGSDSVDIQITTSTPAVSFLQVLLVFVPFGLAGVAWGVVLLRVSSRFQSSLMANLIATLSGSEPTLGTMWHAPEVELVDDGETAVLRTNAGVVSYVGAGTTAHDILLGTPALEKSL